MSGRHRYALTGAEPTVPWGMPVALGRLVGFGEPAHPAVRKNLMQRMRAGAVGIIDLANYGKPSVLTPETLANLDTHKPLKDLGNGCMWGPRAHSAGLRGLPDSSSKCVLAIVRRLLCRAAINLRWSGR
jgi:hypothetical protein